MQLTSKKSIYIGLLVFAVILGSVSIFKSKVFYGWLEASVSEVVNISAEVIGQNKTDKNFHILFVGDMMFDRGVRKSINSNGYNFVFGDSPSLFDKSKIGGPDLVVANLEGPITDQESKTLQKNGDTSNGPLNFTFATTTALELKNVGVDVASLANNHSYNRGQDGLVQTRRYLTDAGVDFFGDPGNLSGHSIVKCIYNDNQKKLCIGLVGYHEFAYKNGENIISDIKELKNKADIVIVMPHWGIEYQKTPSKLQRSLAHQWIDAGADIIVGSHPHVVESIEEYNGHKIFYSLGNYIFDQYFSFDTTHGMAIDINIPEEYLDSTSTTSNVGFASTSQNSIDVNNVFQFGFKLIPIENKHTVMTFPDASTTDFILRDLAGSSLKYVGTTTYNSILNGKI